MASGQRDDGDTVEVRVLGARYGESKQGDVIRVSRSEYERCSGRMSALSGKVVGASLRLLSDEKKADTVRRDADKAKNDLHLARRKQFEEQAQASRDAQALRADAEAKAASERAQQLKAARPPK